MVKQEHSSKPADPWRAPRVHASEAFTFVELLNHLQAEIRITLDRSTIDAATMPNNASTLLKSNLACASTKPHCTMPRGLIVVNVKDATPLHD
jgi:hypothetical protein